MKKIRRIVGLALAVTACMSAVIGSYDTVYTELSSNEITAHAEEMPTIPTEELVEAEIACWITMVSEPKTEYTIGEELDLSGLLVDVIFAPGGEIPISQLHKYETVKSNVNPLDDSETFIVDTSAFDPSKAGSYEITIDLTDEAMRKWWYCPTYRFNVNVKENILPDENTQRVTVVDAETGKPIEISSDKDHSISFHTNYQVEFALLTGGFMWGSLPGTTSTWAYNAENPHMIDISDEPNGFGVDSYTVDSIDLPDGYILPEDHIEAVEYENNSADIYIKLLKSTVSDIKGDVNNDGAFNVADVVTLQKWLLAVPDAKLANWNAGDLCVDNRLDVFDLCLMKRLLWQQM